MDEGIIFGDYLLNKKQFSEVFEKWYKQKKNNFLEALETNIIGPIEAMIYKVQSERTGKEVIHRKKDYNAQKIYQNWENICENYFGNSSIKILARLSVGKRTQAWTMLLDEKEVMQKSGVAISQKKLEEINKTKDITTLLVAVEVEEKINSHYKLMNMFLKDHKLNKEEGFALHKLLAQRRSSIIKNKNKESFTENTYFNILFKSQQEGKRLDAFMNHVGNMHNQLFLLFLKKEVDNEDDLNKALETLKKLSGEKFDPPETVKETQEWLVESLNTTPWFAGGDIVVVGENNSVIYNIQLKTTATKKVFELSLYKLKIFAEKMKTVIEEPEDLAELMYNNLKINSANEIKEITDSINKEILEGVYKKLKIN